jgi:hypothetical protein
MTLVMVSTADNPADYNLELIKVIKANYETRSAMISTRLQIPTFITANMDYT